MSPSGSPSTAAGPPPVPPAAGPECPVERFARWNWGAVGLCCVAAVLQPLTPPWVVVALIAPALLVMAIALLCAQGEWREISEAAELADRWRRQRDRCR